MPRISTGSASTTTSTKTATSSRRRPPTSQSQVSNTSAASSSRTNDPNSSNVSFQVVPQQLPDGQVRDLIVLDDSPSPPPFQSAPSSSRNKQQPAESPPRRRTRAQNAAAAGGASSSTATAGTNGTAAAGSSSKKRKADDGGGRAEKVVKTLPSGGESSSGSHRTTGQQQHQYPVVASGITSSSSGAHRSNNHQQHQQHHAPLFPPSAPPAQPAWDDPEGHYIIQPGDMIYSRYRVVRKLGEGTFGKVVEAIEQTSKRSYAIKIIRAVQKYRDASKIEIRVLNALKDGDPNNQHKCIHLTECFDHRNHVCLVFELLSSSVFDFLKDNAFAPFPIRHIQDFARQLLTSVAYMHKLSLVHTDLKPENILLADAEFEYLAATTPGQPKRRVLKNTDIRLIDFGSATFEKEYHSTVVSTRHYRAPEIILGLGWSYPCDLFSIGCILVEFLTGEALFQTHGNLEHLAMMEIVMGKMPADMNKMGVRAKPEFFRNNKLDYPNSQTDRSSKKFLKGMKTLNDIICPTPSAQRDAVMTRFADLIKKLLHWDPNRRLGVHEALNHPFFHLRVELS